MDASQNTLKKIITDLLCSGELLFGVNYQVEINNLSNYCDLSFNDIRSIIAGIVTTASVTPINLSTMSTGIGFTVQQLVDNNISGSDISTLSTAIGGPLALTTLNSLAAIAGLSTLSTTIGTASNLVGPGFSTLSTATGLTSNTIGPGLSTVALFTSNTNNLAVATSNTLYGVISSGLSTLSTFTGQTSNLIAPGFSTFSTLVSQNYSTLSATTALTSNTIGPGFSTLSTAIGIQVNQFSSFSTYTLQTLSTLSTQIFNSFSSINALTSTTQAGLSSLSSQLGLALFAIPSTVSTGAVLTSTLDANSATISTLNVLSSLRVNGILYVGTGTTTIDTNSISSGSLVLCNISVMQTAYFNTLRVQNLTSPDLASAASTLSTGIAQTYSTLSANTAALQPLSTFEVFTASNLSSLRFTAGVQPYWLVTGAAPTLSKSYDGLNWQNIVNGNANGTNSVTWNGTYWLLCGSGNPAIQKSYDGINWIPSAYMGLSEVYSVSWNGTQWLAAGLGSAGQTMAKSFDGLTWSTLRTPFWSKANGSVWNGSTWITYGSNNATPTLLAGSPAAPFNYYTDSTIAVYNPVGDVFTSVFISSVNQGSAYTKSITSIDWNTDGYFVGLGDFRGIYKSVNGVEWSNVIDTGINNNNNQRFTDGSYLQNLTAVKTNGPQWIVVGSNSVPNRYSTNSLYTLDAGLKWSTNTIPISSFLTGGGLFYNSNNNYWLATGSSKQNSSIVYSLDGSNWTVGGSNVGVGTGLFWNGSPNCNVAQVWGTLGVNSIVAASSITVPVLLAGSISSGTLVANYSTLSSYISGTSNLIAPGFSSFSTITWQNFSTLSTYIQGLSTGLSNLRLDTTFASNFLYGLISSGFSSLSTVIWGNFSTQSSLIFNNFSTLSTLTGFTSNLIGPSASSFSTIVWRNFSTQSSLIFNNFSTLSTLTGFTSNIIGPSASSFSTIVWGNFSTQSSLIFNNFSTLSTLTGITSNTIGPSASSFSTIVWRNFSTQSSLIFNNFSTLSTIIGFTSNSLVASTAFLYAVTSTGLSTLSTTIGQTSNLIGNPPIISTYSTLLVSSALSSLIINTSSLFVRGLSAMSNISSVQGTFSTIGIGYQAVGGNVTAGGIAYPTILNINGTGRVSTLIVDSICYASTFVGSFVFSIQTI